MKGKGRGHVFSSDYFLLVWNRVKSWGCMACINRRVLNCSLVVALETSVILSHRNLWKRLIKQVRKVNPTIIRRRGV
jgi:uncharacterized protein YjeT (DUF2065 family)